MKAEKLYLELKEEFVAYCLKHRSEVDDSFLYEKDFENFIPGDENPTYIIREDGKIIAAASLIVDDYHRRGRKGRFRIFYSERRDPQIYSILLEEIRKHTEGLDKVFLFVPFANKELEEVIKELHFSAERYVFLLVCELKETVPCSLPVGYTLKTFKPDRDEEDWCYIRNTAFANLKGNSTPITTDMVHKMVSEAEYLEGGLIFLLHEDKPIGIVRGARDEYEGEPCMNIGPIAVLPAHQGKGLGKQLLRTAVEFAGKMNFKKTMLCVNADNERAKELYLKEGFVQTEGVTAYEYLLKET